MTTWTTKLGLAALLGLFLSTIAAAKDAHSVLEKNARDLNSAIELDANIQPGEQTYIIYYANETDPESVQRLATWLATSDQVEHQDVAKALGRDAERFPAVVAEEIAALARGVFADPTLGLIVFTNDLADRGVFQFTGCDDVEPKLVKWPVFQSKLKVFQSHPLAHPRSLDLALHAVAEKLTKAEIEKSDFVLISKSHGSQELAIAQGHAPLHEAVSSQELFANLAELKSAAEQSKELKRFVKSELHVDFDNRLGLETKTKLAWGDQLGSSVPGENGQDRDSEANSLDPPGGAEPLGTDDDNLNAIDGLAATGETATATSEVPGDAASAKLSMGGDDTLEAQPVMGPDALGAAGDTANSTLGAAGDTANSTLNAVDGLAAAKFLVSGTSKGQFLNAVSDASKRGMKFHTVFIESCKSELSQSTLKQIRQQSHGNIGRLFTSSTSGLNYATLDYDKLFASLKRPARGGETPRFATAFANTMNEIARMHRREGLPVYQDRAREFTVIAHRGASGYLPEHTLEAYALAYGMGADFIEQDLVLTKDHQPVVLHDIYLDTVTNVAELFPDRKREDGRFYAIDFTLEEIRTLSVHERINHETGEPVFASRFPQGKSSFQVPTLVEAIELIQGLNRASGKNVGIYPEIKKPRWHREQGADISQIVLTTLGDAGYQTKEDAIYLQCFDPSETRRLREELGCQLRLVQLIGSNDWNEADVDYNSFVTPEGLQAIAEYADGIGPWMPYLVKGRDADGRLKMTKLVKRAHNNDLVVHPFTFRADSLPEYAADFGELVRIFRNAGVDGLFTDQPAQAIEAVDAQNTSAPAALRSASRCDPKSDPSCD